MKLKNCTDLTKIKIKKRPLRALKSQNLYHGYSVFSVVIILLVFSHSFMTLTSFEILHNGNGLSLRTRDSIITSIFLTGLTFEKLFIRWDKEYKMDDLAKFVSEMVQKFPEPEDFIKEIEKTDIPEKDKGDYLFEIGRRLNTISNFKLCLEVLDQAIEYYLKFDNKAGEAKCYKGSGLAYLALGEVQKGIEYTNKSLAIAIATGDKTAESYCNNNLGLAYFKIADFDKAIEHFNKAYEISKARGDKIVEARCCDNLGSIYIFQGDFKKGLENYLKGLEVFRSLGNKEDEAICLSNIGMAYWNLGDFHKAIEYEMKSLEIETAIGSKSGESQSYVNLSNAYSDLGNFRKSIEYLIKALEIRKEIGDKDGEAFCYQNMGADYERLGDYSKAIAYYNKSLEISRAIGNKRTEAYCYGGLGWIYHLLEDFPKGIEYHNKSLEIAKAIGDKSNEACEYRGLGSAYHRLGDFNKAVEYHKKSLAIAKKIDSKESKFISYDSLGDVYASLNNFGKAIEYYKRALEIVEEIKEIHNKKLILGNIGKAYFKKEDYREGEKYFRQSAEIIENMRKESIPKEYKRSFWKDNIPIFDNLIISDVKLEKKEAALEYSERGKGRTVFDYILGRGIEENVFKPEPLNFKEIQELVKRIEKNLVLFRVTEKGTYSFILNQEGKFDLLEFPEFNTKRLEELTVKLEAGKPTSGWIHAYSNYKSVQENVNKLRAEKTNIEIGRTIKEAEGTWFKTMDETLKILYDELIGKVFSRFEKGDKVVIIPNRALNILPLHACFYEEPPAASRLPQADSGKRIAISVTIL